MVAGLQREIGRSLWIEQQLINLAEHEGVSNIANTDGERLPASHAFLELVNHAQLPGHNHIPENRLHISRKRVITTIHRSAGPIQDSQLCGNGVWQLLGDEAA